MRAESAAPFKEIYKNLAHFFATNNISSPSIRQLNIAHNSGAKQGVLCVGFKFDTHHSPSFSLSGAGHRDVMAALLDKGADIDAQDMVRMCTRTP